MLNKLTSILNKMLIKKAIKMIKIILITALVIMVETVSLRGSEIFYQRDTSNAGAQEGNDLPEINAFVPVDKQPEVVVQVPPVYPKTAKRKGIEGSVYVKMLVGKNGKVLKAVIIQTDNEVFNQPSIDAALQFVFTPAIAYKKPVIVWVLVPFKFKLNRHVTAQNNNISIRQDNEKSTQQVDSTYKTVKIGEQIWMTENLNVDHYRNGDPIPEVQNSIQWLNLKTGAWWYYKNDSVNGEIYGKLYNWYAVNGPRGLAPEGWHVPTKTEFQTLIKNVNKDGNALKAIGQGQNFAQYKGAGTNTSGFSAMFAGCRSSSDYFDNLDYFIFLWSSTCYRTSDVYILEMFNMDSDISIKNYGVKNSGYSVRCLRDY